MHVGAQVEQICANSTIEIVGHFLNLKNFKLPENGNYSDQEAVVTAAACKINPANKQTTIAAIAYESNDEFSKSLVIAMIDNKHGQVISSYKSEIGEDAGMRVESGSLWIDTAAYNLQNGVRAFGLDVTSGYIPHPCVDGGFGAIRTMYIVEGKTIRPVLSDLMMSHWSYIQRGQTGCGSAPDAPEESTLEYFDLSISISNSKTNGFSDLLITAYAYRDDDKKDPHKPFHFKLLYDGKKYSTDQLEKAFWKWRGPF